MSDQRPDLVQDQREHWQGTYRANPVMYGSDASKAAVYAADVFAGDGTRRILELGAGHGRDTLYFAQQGLEVVATDFSDIAVAEICRAAQAQGVATRVTAMVHDLRDTLPDASGSVDAVYAHMALCMALSTKEIRAAVDEVRRVLRPGGKFIYTVRHTGDAHYGTGPEHSDGIFESGGFAVHFFSRELVNGLAAGWNLDEVHDFEEGELPRRLWRITLTKPG